MPRLRRIRIALLALAGALLLSACAGVPMTDLSALPPMPQSTMVADVPFFPQKERYCGPASLAMVLAWSGEAVTQDEVATQFTRRGARARCAMTW